MKFETIVQAAKRKLMEETGIRGGFYGSPITAQEAIFPDSAFGIPAHTISVIVPVRLTRNPKRIVLDAQSSEAQWFSRIHSAWPAYIKRALRLAGFR